MSEATSSLDRTSVEDREWLFRLTFGQRFLNPPGIACFALMYSMIGVYFLWQLILFPAGAILYVPLIAFFGFVVWGFYHGSDPPDFSLKRQLCICIRGDDLGYGNNDTLMWIPCMNIKAVGKGVLGCAVIVLYSGHKFVIPAAVADSDEFRRWFAKKPSLKWRWRWKST